MPERLHPPIRLPGATWTRILQDRINAYADKIVQRGENLFPDGIFPGTVDLSGRQKYQQYLNATVDIGDFSRLATPGYEETVRNGLLPPDDPGPQSPFWKQALMIPGQFTEMAKEFVRLNEKYAGGQT